MPGSVSGIYPLCMAKVADPKFSHDSVRSYEDGETIFAEGEDSREMYVVKSGEVIVSKRGARTDIELAILRKGEFLGEMSLLESLPRSATAKARGRTLLLAIQPGGFLLKIRRDPTFAYELLQTLSRRIRILNHQLVEELSREEVSSATLTNLIQTSEFKNT